MSRCDTMSAMRPKQVLMLVMAVLTTLSFLTEVFVAIRVWNEYQFLEHSAGDRVTLKGEGPFRIFGKDYPPGRYVVVPGGLRRIDGLYTDARITLTAPLVLTLAFGFGWIRMRARVRARGEVQPPAASAP